MEEAYASLKDPVRLRVEVTSMVYQPIEAVKPPKGRSITPAEPLECCPYKVSDLAADSLVLRGGYAYRVEVVDGSAGKQIKVYNLDRTDPKIGFGEFLWSWIVKDGVARETYRKELPVEHKLSEGDINGRDVRLACGHDINFCSVLFYRPSFSGEHGVFRQFPRYVGKSERIDCGGANLEVWIRVRERKWEDGATWERTDVRGLDPKTYLPAVWDSQEVERSPKGAITSIEYKTRRFVWN